MTYKEAVGWNVGRLREEEMEGSETECTQRRLRRHEWAQWVAGGVQPKE